MVLNGRTIQSKFMKRCEKELLDEDSDEFSLINILYELIPSALQNELIEDVWLGISEGTELYDKLQGTEILRYILNDNDSVLEFDLSDEGRKEINSYVENMIISAGCLVPDDREPIDIITVPCNTVNGPREYIDGPYIRTADDFAEHIDESVFGDIVACFTYPEQVVKFMRFFVEETYNKYEQYVFNIEQKAQFIGILLFTEQQQPYIRTLSMLEDELYAKIYIGENRVYSPTLNDENYKYFKPDELIQYHIFRHQDIHDVVLGIVFGNVLREYHEKGGKW